MIFSENRLTLLQIMLWDLPDPISQNKNGARWAPFLHFSLSPLSAL